MSLQDRFILEDLDNYHQNIPALIGKIFTGFIRYKKETWFLFDEIKSQDEIHLYIVKQFSDLFGRLVTQQALRSFVNPEMKVDLVEQGYKLKQSFNNINYMKNLLKELPQYL